MQFTSFAIAALSIGSALAQSDVTVHVVKVGSMNGTLKYSPDNLQAAVGDMVQFQFAPANHTVTQSTFDQPCQPSAMNSNVTGIYSGYMPVAANATDIPTYTIQIANTNPMWLYCSQGKHCQNGMVMVINENTAKNASRSLANYASLAKLATANLAPGSVPTNSSSGSGSTTGSTGSDSNTGSGSSGTTPSTPSNVTASTGAGSMLQPVNALSFAGFLAAGAAFFL